MHPPVPSEEEELLSLLPSLQWSLEPVVAPPPEKDRFVCRQNHAKSRHAHTDYPLLPWPSSPYPPRKYHHGRGRGAGAVCEKKKQASDLVYQPSDQIMSAHVVSEIRPGSLGIGAHFLAYTRRFSHDCLVSSFHCLCLKLTQAPNTGMPN